MEKQRHLVIKRPLKKTLDEISNLVGLHFSAEEACHLCNCTYKEYEKFLPQLKDTIKFANECRERDPSIENDKDIKDLQESIRKNKGFMKLYYNDKAVNYNTCKGYYDLCELLKSDYLQVI